MNKAQRKDYYEFINSIALLCRAERLSLHATTTALQAATAALFGGNIWNIDPAGKEADAIEKFARHTCRMALLRFYGTGGSHETV